MKPTSAQLKRAKAIIRQHTAQAKKGWLGVAPSYFCENMGISYEKAATILKDLEEEGFLYDNGNGNHFNLPDGRRYATRYFMMEYVP